MEGRSADSGWSHVCRFGTLKLVEGSKSIVISRNGIAGIGGLGLAPSLTRGCRGKLSGHLRASESVLMRS